MKLRNFKKAIRRVGYYRYHIPKILNKIEGRDDCFFVYYKCHKLNCKLSLTTNKFIFN